MKAKEVLNLLRVSRQTLTRYVKTDLIRTTRLPNGQYDYNAEDIYKLFNKGMPGQTVIYARVSTPKQKKDLENQIEMLKQFCFANGYTISAIFSDIASGNSFKERSDFFKLLDLVLDGKIERVVISYKGRLSRVGFDLFYYLFKKYKREIVVMSEVGSPKLDSEEIVSLLHCYSMKLYSKRKKDLVEKLIKEDTYE
jgi:predicted site-specific integrase-resolvase